MIRDLSRHQTIIIINQVYYFVLLSKFAKNGRIATYNHACMVLYSYGLLFSLVHFLTTPHNSHKQAGIFGDVAVKTIILHGSISCKVKLTSEKNVLVLQKYKQLVHQNYKESFEDATAILHGISSSDEEASQLAS